MLTTDHLGSPRVVTDEDGRVTSRRDYTAFGEESITPERAAGLGYAGQSETRKGYTGYEKDTESGLDFAQARYYNSVHGRFTSVDPLTASATIRNPQTFNRYTYVLNSPYKFTDPLGLIPETTGACGSRCRNSDGGSGFWMGRDASFDWAVFTDAGVASAHEAEHERELQSEPPTPPPPPASEQNGSSATVEPEQDDPLSRFMDEVENRMFDIYVSGLEKAESIPEPTVLRTSMDPIALGEILEVGVSGLGLTVTSTNDSAIDRFLGNTVPGYYADVTTVRTARDAELASVRQRTYDKLVGEFNISSSTALSFVNQTDGRAATRYWESNVARGQVQTWPQWFNRVLLSPWNSANSNSMIRRWNDGAQK